MFYKHKCLTSENIIINYLSNLELFKLNYYKYMVRHYLFLAVFIICFPQLYSQSAEKTNTCNVASISFKPGEQLVYEISYNWFVIFSEVGLITMGLEEAVYNNQDVYHFYAEGKSYSWWDKFMMVRDKYEVWLRKDNLRPVFFQRNTLEGSWTQHETYDFDGDSLIYRKNKIREKPYTYDTLSITPCTWDILGALAYSRNFDYSSKAVGEIIPVSVALDEEVYDLYFRYQGIEEMKLRGVGTFECQKYSVMLVEGTLFHEGENMTIWVTNDDNHIPVYVETPILVGNIRAKLLGVRGNKYPLKAKIK